MLIELTNDDRTRILRELDKQECFCGARKARRQTFCRPHHESLPDWMRNRLYQRAGDGYEEAYTAAREYFEKAKEHDGLHSDTN